MSKISSNIKFLRKKFGLTQAAFADKIGVNRPAVGAYEEERAEPKLNTLTTIASTFGLSVDALISKDLTRLSDKEFDGIKVDITGQKMRVLAITVDNDEKEGVQLVPQKASAGYSNGFADPEYLEELPKLYLPMLSGSTHRAFELKGDSMLPLTSGTIVIGSYVDNWNNIQSGKTYVCVTKSEGVVYKRVENNIFNNGSLKLISDNTVYEPYEVAVEDLEEVWEAVMYMSQDFPQPENTMSMDQLAKTVLQLQQEVIKLKTGE